MADSSGPFGEVLNSSVSVVRAQVLFAMSPMD